MDKELSELKKELRSLVVSSPSQVDVRSLLRDYREMVGRRLPIAKYGYRDPVKFLVECCSDSFQFQGPSDNPILNLIVTDNLKHIDKFVRSQRISGAAKLKGKRRSVQGTPCGPAVFASKPSQKDLIYTSFNKNKKDVPNVAEAVARPNHYKDKSNIRTEESIVKGAKSKESKPISAVRADTPNDDLDICTSSSGSGSSRQRALFQVKANIKEIVFTYPEGVWCTALPSLYRERFGDELRFDKYGYTSLISLVLELGDEIAVTRPTPSDWLLQPSSVSDCHPRLPRAPHFPYVPWASRLRLAAYHSDEDALPGVAIEPGVFPEDCMQFMAHISPVGVEDIAEGAMLEVMVSELYSPSRFWIQRLGERYNLALEELMDEMDLYYRGEGSERRLSVGAVRVGYYVACKYEDSWHRALIVRIVDSNTVKVRHVDYGTVCAVRTSGLRPLLQRFAALPTQAIRATLAEVRPAAGGRRWPHAAGSYLLGLVSDRQLVACVHAVDLDSATLELQLVDTAGDDDVYLAERLLRAGHADHHPHSSLQSDECYLLPTFDALEGAHTLSFFEIHQCLRDGIDVEFLEDYRRHVAPLVPSPSPSPAPSAASAPSPAEAPLSPPADPLECGLTSTVCDRFLALATVNSDLATRYMVEEIVRLRTHNADRSSRSDPDPAPRS